MQAHPHSDLLRLRTTLGFGFTLLYPVSPTALRDVMSTNTYDFVKPWGLRALLARIIGFGLITSEGVTPCSGQERQIAKSFLSILDPDPHVVVFFGLNLILPTFVAGCIPTAANRVVGKESAYLRKFCEGILDEKKAKPEGAKHTEGKIEDADILGNIIAGKEFSRQEIVDQMLTFVAAGHETTASSMSWAFHLLTLPEYRHYQKILCHEVRAAIRSLDGHGRLAPEDAPLYNVIESLP
ncbi:hypothetical protein MPH_02042 [Macrophomina phaseolina MS6]|uniref:Cytochrome P450 n=1 Tax=Macrophomina phaseolina (strain MS6) TaxID=1126212 RepID=K2S702_MACPH|nr:hypothetical protein MPH_02042 [Macrophomina phaseolina MS6]